MGAVVGDTPGDLYTRLARRSVEVDGCWIWTGTLRDGYGRIELAGRTLSTHRASYEFFVGPIPAGLVLDHLCRVRNCWHPDHLDPVPLAVNLWRSPLYPANRAASQVRAA